jgi:hypothetical protein
MCEDKEEPYIVLRFLKSAGQQYTRISTPTGIAPTATFTPGTGRRVSDSHSRSISWRITLNLKRNFTCSFSTSKYSVEYWSSSRQARAAATKYGISFKANIAGPEGLYNSGLIIGVVLVQKLGTHSEDQIQISSPPQFQVLKSKRLTI